MRRGKQTLMRDHPWFSIALIGMVVVASLCLAWARAGQPVGRNTDVIGPVAPGGREPVGRQILSAATQAFRPSLEMKENVDFLLTPALLVQEAMSAEVVTTYPSE